MVRASLKNPYAVVAVSLMVILLGVVSYQKMVVDIFPEIKVPVVAVATFYKGMGPSEIEGAITLRLEQLFLQASYVEHIESRSLPGVSLIKIYFHPEYNVDLLGSPLHAEGDVSTHDHQVRRDESSNRQPHAQ